MRGGVGYIGKGLGAPAHLVIVEVSVDVHLGRSGLLLLEAVLAFPDAADELLVVFGDVALDRVVAVLADHAFEQVADLDLEVVRVLVRPVDERGNESRQGRRHERRVERDDRDLDKAETGLDDLAVRRPEEDDNRLQKLGLVLVLERGCRREFSLATDPTFEVGANSPRNSHVSRPRAPIVAAIMCGLVAASPALSMVTYSSAVASTSSSFIASSMPLMRCRLTRPPEASF